MSDVKAKPEPVKKRITYVSFSKEQGIQIVPPNGKFLRSCRESPASSHDTDFHVIGIKEVIPNQFGLAFVLKSGLETHVPYAQIASFRVE